MTKLFSKIAIVGCLAGMALMSGCSYAGVATTSNNQVVIARNDGLLFGILRAVYVCL